MNQFVTVTDNSKFCIGTTLLCIESPYILLPFTSILYNVGILVLAWVEIKESALFDYSVLYEYFFFPNK